MQAQHKVLPMRWQALMVNRATNNELQPSFVHVSEQLHQALKKEIPIQAFANAGFYPAGICVHQN